MLSIIKDLFKSDPKPYAYTVEEIHKEIDTAQDRLIREADKLLRDLKIPTETDIERKAKLLREIGFHNSVTVDQAKSLEQERKRQEIYIKDKKTEAQLLRDYKVSYPFQKFLTISEFDRICDKYGLIYSTISNYIRDVPEKNLLDIKNAAPLKQSDLPKAFILFQIKIDRVTIRGLTDREIEEVKNGIVIDPDLSEYRTWGGDYESNSKVLTAYYKKEVICTSNDGSWRDNEKRYISSIKRTGYNIAAPKSHFNLEGTIRITEKGFFITQKISEPLDPIVFEYCRGEMVRIITKWGTEDDQSYLDPKLVNETLN